MWFRVDVCPLLVKQSMANKIAPRERVKKQEAPLRNEPVEGISRHIMIELI